MAKKTQKRSSVGGAQQQPVHWAVSILAKAAFS
jgi:hypothetical protein